MKWEDTGLKSPLARARGLGAAHDGTTHWIHQRITAISNLIWLVWFAISVLTLDLTRYDDVFAWVAMPHNAVLLILTVISSFYHAVLGVQVVIEDYIHCEGYKFFKLIGMRLFYIALAVASVFSVLKVAL